MMGIWWIWCRCLRRRPQCSVKYSSTIHTGCIPLKDELNPFDDIPGTTLFDAQRSRQGYHLNMFCMSLMKADNRAAFKADEAAYLQKFPLSPEQRTAVLERDWNGMIALGGNIYSLAKLFS